MKQAIFDYHQDAENHWVARLACGHTQHLRHNPPWQNRPWVLTVAGRAGHLGRGHLLPQMRRRRATGLVRVIDSSPGLGRDPECGLD